MEECEALVAEAALRERRQGGAFAAARSLLSLRMEGLAQDLKGLQGRFDKRESRSDDVTRIRLLERELRGAQALEKKQCASAKQLKLQLDNRDNNDLLFGGPVNAGLTQGAWRKAPGLQRAANRLEPLLGGNEKVALMMAHPASHQASSVAAFRNTGARYVANTGFKH